MVDITLVELHLEDSAFDLQMPFSASKEGGDPTDDDDDGATGADSDGPGKGLAAVGVLVVLVVIAALAKYLSGDDGEDLPDVAIETADDEPVGVAADE
ncbi:MAG: hypothetical protein V5A55_04925 [Halovenus sp.]